MNALGHFATRSSLLAICLLGMVTAVFGNVILRYFWGTEAAVSEESRLLFVWLVSLAATLTFGEGKHLGFDLVTERVKGKAASALLRWLSRGLIAVALYYLVRGAWAQVLVGMDSRSPVMNYPLALGGWRDFCSWGSAWAVCCCCRPCSTCSARAALQHPCTPIE